MASLIDLSGLGFYDQERAYREVRQRGESSPLVAVKCSFNVNPIIKRYVESDLWQKENYFWLAA